MNRISFLTLLVTGALGPAYARVFGGSGTSPKSPGSACRCTDCRCPDCNGESCSCGADQACNCGDYGNSKAEAGSAAAAASCCSGRSPGKAAATSGCGCKECRCPACNGESCTCEACECVGCGCVS